MKVDNKLISKLEEISFLHLTDSERQRMVIELEKMVDMIDFIRNISIDKEYIEDIEENVLRNDEVKDHLSTQSALLNSSNTWERYFTVPKVIDA